MSELFILGILIYGCVWGWSILRAYGKETRLHSEYFGPHLRRYRVTWLGQFGSACITEEEWFCYATSKRQAHKHFLKFIEPRIRKQYTDESNLRNFEAIESDITEC